MMAGAPAMATLDRKSEELLSRRSRKEYELNAQGVWGLATAGVPEHLGGARSNASPAPLLPIPRQGRCVSKFLVENHFFSLSPSAQSRVGRFNDAPVLGARVHRTKGGSWTRSARTAPPSLSSLELNSVQSIHFCTKNSGMGEKVGYREAAIRASVRKVAGGFFK